MVSGTGNDSLNHGFISRKEAEHRVADGSLSSPRPAAPRNGTWP